MDYAERPDSGAGYCSFLVRLWRDSPRTDWRASSENTLTGEKHSFATFDLLVHFLQTQTRDVPPIESLTLAHPTAAE